MRATEDQKQQEKEPQDQEQPEEEQQVDQHSSSNSQRPQGRTEFYLLLITALFVYIKTKTILNKLKTVIATSCGSTEG